MAISIIMNHNSMLLARTIVGIIGNAISLALYLSPLPTIKRIIDNESVEKFHPYIYIAGILNCCLWILYGSPSIHPKSTFIWTINSLGLILYTIYLGVFLFYAPIKKKLYALIGIGTIVTIMVTVSVLTLVLVHTTSERGKVIGIICVIVNVGYYAAPLTIVTVVIKSKSVEFLPIWICVAGLVNSVVWTGYSLLPFDINILVSNGVGIVLGLFQMGLHWRFGNCFGGQDSSGSTS